MSRRANHRLLPEGSALARNSRSDPPPPYPNQGVVAHVADPLGDRALQPPAGQHLMHPKFYRLYTQSRSSVFPSIRPLEDDPSLSMFYLEHVSPPHIVRNLIHHICARENLHPRNVELSINEGGNNANNQRNTAELLLSDFNIQQIGSRDRPYQLVFHCIKTDEWRPERRLAVGRLFSGLAEDNEMVQTVRNNRLLAHLSSGALILANQRLPTQRPVYYRLYWSQRYTAMPSLEPLDDRDPSLSRTYEERISPPRTASEYIKHIASREGFHPDRIKLFRREGENRVEPDQRLRWSEDGFGSPLEALLISVDVGGRPDGGPNRENGMLRPGLFPAAFRWLRLQALDIFPLALQSLGRGASMIPAWLVVYLVVGLFVEWMLKLDEASPPFTMALFITFAMRLIYYIGFARLIKISFVLLGISVLVLSVEAINTYRSVSYQPSTSNTPSPTMRAPVAVVTASTPLNKPDSVTFSASPSIEPIEVPAISVDGIHSPTGSVEDVIDQTCDGIMSRLQTLAQKAQNERRVKRVGPFKAVAT